MGISGLLPVLKSITESKTIDQYAGQTIAIDGYCW
jgi:exonuclease-1